MAGHPLLKQARRITTAIALFLFTFVARPAIAAQSVAPNPLSPALTRVVVLEGRVTSTARTPVRHAEVRLSRGGSVIANTLSDDLGVYRFTNAASDAGVPPLISAGSYAIEAQYRGTTKPAGTVAIARNTTAHRDIALGVIVKKGGASTPPRTAMIVTDRTTGSSFSPLSAAFTNERPTLGCQPSPVCDLHFGIVRASGPIIKNTFEPAADVDAFMGLMNAVYPTATSITVFVHGFNNDFEGPVRITATAVAGTDAATVPLAYSWPSKNVTAKYIDDESNNAWAAEHFRDFLIGLLQRADAPKTVNVIAHSMGNRLALEALTFIARAKPTLVGGIGQVVFAAPDVDAATFWEAVPVMAGAAQGLTVYGSHHDEALQLSRELHGHCRAGLVDCDDSLVLPANVNAIDASYFKCDLIGHGYWSASTTMLGDIAATMSVGTIGGANPLRPHLQATGIPGRFRFISAAANDSACASEPAK